MSLLNKKAAKQFILDTAKDLGRTEFTRVGSGSFDFLEEVLKKTIQDEVQGHGTIGKTLNLGDKVVQEDNGEPVKAPEAQAE